MQILVSTSAAVDWAVKNRIAIKVERSWMLGTVTGIRRKYVDFLFDDGDEGEFNKVDDARSVKLLPKGTRKNKQALTLNEVKELIEQGTPAKAVKAQPVKQVTRRVMDMSESPAPQVKPKSRPITISMKQPAAVKEGRPITIKAKPAREEPAVIAPQVPQTTGTLKTRLKENDDKPIHPIDLNRGMVVQVAVSASLVTVLLLDYDEEQKKWSAVLLRENSKIIQVSQNHCFTRKAPLTKYEKLWAGKYMRRLEEMES